MGRKSTRGKEKKLKRKMENAALAEKQKVVDSANSLKDPLDLLAPLFRKYERNGLNLKICCDKVDNLDENAKQWIFDITKANMQELYERAECGWSERKKKDELWEEGVAWYLLARNESSEPVAMVHFRFDMEEGDEVLYCYELQLVESARRKGLGKFLMQILELIAFKTKMIKVMLTVFKHNKDAMIFYQEKLKYEVDETNQEEDVYDACNFDTLLDYLILSKSIGVKKPLSASQTANQAA